MSADNGIYVFLTETERGPEYRVAHAQAIDNIYGEWDPVGAKYKGNTEAILDVFNESEVFYTLNEALDKAEELENDIGYTEDGICVISDFKEYNNIFT